MGKITPGMQFHPGIKLVEGQSQDSEKERNNPAKPGQPAVVKRGSEGENRKLEKR